MVRSWLCLHVEAEPLLLRGSALPPPCGALGCSPTGSPSSGSRREAMRGCQRPEQRGPGGPGLCHLCHAGVALREARPAQAPAGAAVLQGCSPAPLRRPRPHAARISSERSLCSVHGFCRHTTHFSLSRWPSVPEDEYARAGRREGGAGRVVCGESCGRVRCSAPLSPPGLCLRKGAWCRHSLALPPLV